MKDLLCDLEKLEEGDKHVRKQALENISSFLKSICDDLPENKRKVVVSLVIRPLLSVLGDATEKCRELAAQLLLEMCSTLPVSDDATTYIFPALKAKLHTETCEEVRLIEAQTLTQTVTEAGGKSAKHLHHVIDAIRACLSDPFSEIKKEGCRCVVQLEKAVPQHFHLQCESLLAPLIQVARHQHSAVRILAVEALGPVVQQSSVGALGRALPTANALLRDGSPAVRAALVTAASRWLAYGFSPAVLSVLLVALSDPVPGVSDGAAALWAEVGLAYAEEKGLRQANSREGCDTLVRQHLSGLVGSALETLEDWRPEERERGARLLLGFLPHAGRDVEPHVAGALPVLAAVLGEDEPRVASLVERVLAAVGRAATPEAWVEALAGPYSPGNLRALRALLGACPPQHLRPYAHQLFPTLFQYAASASEPRSRSDVVESLDFVLASVADPMDLPVKELLCACLGLRAAARRALLAEKVGKLLEHLSRALGLPGVEDLCVVYGKDVIQDLSEDRPHAESPFRWDTLHELVSHAGERRTDLVPSLVALLNASRRRPEWQPRAAAVLELALAQTRAEGDVPAAPLPPQCVGPLLRALVPLLAREGGPCAPARLAALRCLHELLARSATSPLQVGVEVSAAVASLLEDRQPQVRAMACRVAPACLPRAAAAGGLAGRLDDASAEVRLAAARALDTVATEEVLPDVLDGLSLHVHDPNPAVRTACSAVLEKLTDNLPRDVGDA